MDLMTLAAKLELDDSSYRKGVTGAEAMGKQLAGKMSAMTVAVGNLAADMVRKGIAAINSVITGAIDGYADYQQLIGGVETLFKGSADKVAKYAQQSFKTTGLSSNQYMETVTSFSASLLQGLKGDTETAADLANTAVTDMADNANKMGTDISSIQAAYQGFAKQNYTMLDNLKLGYGGTASEMVRLINDSGILENEIKDLDGITFDQLVQAIHVVQQNLGITGTTAKEAADTLSGSKASLAAAWSDFLTSVGGEQDQKKLKEAAGNFKESFQTYVVKNLLPVIQTTLENTPELISAISTAITSLPSKAIKQLISGGVSVLTAGVTSAKEITSWLIDGLVDMFTDIKADPSKITELGNAVGDFIGTALGDIINNAPELVDGLMTAGVSLAGGLVEGLFKGLFGEGAEVDKITEGLQDELTDIDVNNAKASALLGYLDSLYKKYGNAVTAQEEWKQAVSQLEESMPNAGQVFKNMGSNIQGAIDQLNMLNEKMRQTAIQAGIEKALTAQKELYGEQLGQQKAAETKASILQTEKTGLEQGMGQSAIAYAQKILELNASGANLFMGDRLGQVIANAEKTIETGQSDKISELTEALSNYYERNGIEGEDTIWGESLTDKIFDPETIASFESQMTALTTGIENAMQEAEAAGKEAEKTWNEIVVTQAALDSVIAEQLQAYNTATSDVTSGGDSVYSAFLSLAKRINGIVIKPFAGVSYMPKATGIDDVPYTGFRAELHKGEAILTPKEAEAYRNGNGAGEVVGALQGVRQDLQNMRLVVGKKTFGRAVVDYGGRGMSGYIGQSDSRQAAGYGT